MIKSVFPIALALFAAVAAGCSSSSSDSSKNSAGGDYAFIAKAFYGVGVNHVEWLTDNSPYVIAIEFDADGNLVVLDGEDVEAEGAALSATGSEFIFELSGPVVDAGPAYFIVNSTDDASNIVFVQYGADEPTPFLDVNAFAAGTAPDPFPPVTEVNAIDLDGSFVGTGFTLNADGTIAEVFEGDSVSLEATDAISFLVQAGGTFAGMTVTAGGEFFNDGDATLAQYGQFYHDTNITTESVTLGDTGMALVAPDLGGIVFVTCVLGGTCADGAGGTIPDLADYFFSAMFRQ